MSKPIFEGRSPSFWFGPMPGNLGHYTDLRGLTGPNRGASAARNRGVGETTREWIVFLDADDLLVLGTLRLRLETAEPSGADIVVCDWQESLDPGDGTADAAVRSLDLATLEADAENRPRDAGLGVAGVRASITMRLSTLRQIITRSMDEKLTIRAEGGV